MSRAGCEGAVFGGTKLGTSFNEIFPTAHRSAVERVVTDPLCRNGSENYIPPVGTVN